MPRVLGKGWGGAASYAPDTPECSILNDYRVVRSVTPDVYLCVKILVAGDPSGSYRGTSLTRKRTPLGSYRRPVPRVLGVF